MEPLPCAPGDVIGGKYRVEHVVGEGGMGVVVAARHTQLDQLVAIKLVHPTLAQDAAIAERFLREARAVAKLRSDHVAHVLDVGRLESGLPYLVMEYLEGSDLACVLASEGPLSVEVACDYVLQACEAVAEAHALGIVHRDLKPENLFLARRVGGAPLVKVLDFGISKQMAATAQGLTTTRGMVGSPLYMPPEQMRSARTTDPRADVWALGVVLYEALTGRWPYEADSLADLCVKVVNEPPRRIDSVRLDLPPELVTAIHRCLEKDPALRFANAAELASALEPFAPTPSRVLAESARLAMRSVMVTQQASAAAAAEAVTGGHGQHGRVLTARSRRRRFLVGATSLAAVVACACAALAQSRPQEPPLALGALRAALGVPVVAAGETPASPPPLAPPAPVVTSANAPAQRPRAAEATRSPSPPALRPVPRPVRASPPAPSADDDIPAFR